MVPVSSSTPMPEPVSSDIEITVAGASPSQGIGVAKVRLPPDPAILPNNRPHVAIERDVAGVLVSVEPKLDVVVEDKPCRVPSR